jgi:hypothetical protein
MLDDATEVLRLSKDGIWANPAYPAEETAQRVLDALSDNVRVMVEKAVETERESCAQWMITRGFATGHGDSIADLLEELEWQVREREREACAKVCEALQDWPLNSSPYDCAAAIRAREEE